MDIDPKAVGKRIEAAREAKKLTRVALAALVIQRSEKKGDEAGRKKSDYETVRRWEMGLTMPPWTMIRQLARVLEVPAEVLLFGGPLRTLSEPAREAALFVDSFPPEQRSRLVMGFKLTASHAIPDEAVPEVFDAAKKTAARATLRSKTSGPMPLFPDDDPQ